MVFRRMHILMIISSFSAGGAERVLAILANRWYANGKRMSVIALSDTGKSPFFPFASGIDVNILNLQRNSDSVIEGLVRNIGRIIKLRNAISIIKPDIIISFLDLTNVRTLLATWCLEIPVIVSERSDPDKRNIGKIWEMLRRITYCRANALVIQGLRMKNYFSPTVQRKAHIIPNPVILPEDVKNKRADLNRSSEVNTVIALGSLRKEKGFDILIHAFASIAKKCPKWNLIIWGEGPDRKKLESIVYRLGLGKRISMPGITREPFHHLCEADLFVLPSRVEGFPNALTEAMAIGLPVIATDVGAVSEIVQDGSNGLLVPPCDTLSLSVAMEKLMNDQAERLYLGKKALNVSDRYSLKKVMLMWEELIDMVISSRSSSSAF